MTKLEIFCLFFRKHFKSFGEVFFWVFSSFSEINEVRLKWWLWRCFSVCSELFQFFSKFSVYCGVFAKCIFELISILWTNDFQFQFQWHLLRQPATWLWGNLFDLWHVFNKFNKLRNYHNVFIKNKEEKPIENRKQCTNTARNQ